MASGAGGTRRAGPRWPAAGSALLLILAAAGCGAGGRPAPSAATVAAKPVAAEEALRNADRLDASSLQDISVLADGLEGRLAASVRECMAEQGFPQLVEAEQVAVTRPAQGRHDALRIDPLELGPYTVDQARAHGMVGTTLLFDKGEPGSVISRDPAFDEAQDGCRERFSKRADRDVMALIARFRELQNTVHAELLDATEAQVRTLLRERLACVRDDGYPALDVGRVLETRTFADMLRLVGITPAQVEEHPPPPPRVRQGQVVTVPPARPPSYRPPPAEVEFALAYVRCGERGRFVDRLESIQATARASVLAGHEAEVTAIGRALRAAVEATAAGS
jgi:hypothetical protein